MEKNKFNNKNSKNLANIIVALVVFLIGSYVFALAQFGNVEFNVPDESSEEPLVESTDVSEEVSDVSEEPVRNYLYYDDFTLESRAYANSAVANGTLAVVNAKSSSMPIVDDAKLKSVYSVASHKIYGLSGSGLKMYNDAITNFDAFLVSFYEEVPSNGVIINKAYSPFSSGGTDKNAELATGYSLELSTYKSKYKFSDPEFGYLRDQAYRYGLIQRYPAGKSSVTGVDADDKIYRYIGVAHSWYMNLYKYTLEEYVGKITTEKVLEFDSQLEPGVAYVVYYVPLDASKNTTYVPVPVGEKYSYTVSGDGSTGFIVTVKVPKN